MLPLISRYSRSILSKQRPFFVLFGALLTVTLCAQGQTFTLIHSFTGASDGAYPVTGLTLDRAGNLYGTTTEGGARNIGVIFELTPAGSSWDFHQLYSFSGADGSSPESRVAFGPDGHLYGTTLEGGNNNCVAGCGIVFRLTPPATLCRTASCPWRETILYRFTGTPDGFYPSGDLTFDAAGAIYGTASQGGANGPGAVYKLAPSGNSWSESVLYSFTGQADGGSPEDGVTFVAGGRLCGTTAVSGISDGDIYELTPSGSGWTETTLHAFQGGDDGGTPVAGLISNPAGDLFGATLSDGANGGGVIYELTPSGSGYNFVTIYPLTGTANSGPWRRLTMDSAGNLYGTTFGNGGPDYGKAFKLTHTSTGWTETVLHTFSGSDGEGPQSNITIDANGNLYGTTSIGGPFGYGVVFKITP